MYRSFLILIAVVATVSEAAAYSNEDVVAIVEAAENGEGLDEAIETLKRSGDVPPLADAALGRLWVVKSARSGFSITRVLRGNRGFDLLGDYIAVNPDDPYALLWRGRSAVETNYLIVNATTARADLERALEIFDTKRPDPKGRAACYVDLGYLALDFGDLARARTYWELAIITASGTAPAGEAAKMLELTQG
jgi:tetratricopeptide (TPR) repeat protein